MKRTQFIVKVAGNEERKAFHEYIMDTYKLEKWYPFFKRSFINNSFPFVVVLKRKVYGYLKVLLVVLVQPVKELFIE